MNTAEAIIAKFGGIRPMAAVLGIPHTTIQGWKEAGRIPAARQGLVLEKGRKLEDPVTPSDFFPPIREAS